MKQLPFGCETSSIRPPAINFSLALSSSIQAHKINVIILPPHEYQSGETREAMREKINKEDAHGGSITSL
jgi:hypothetical protein